MLQNKSSTTNPEAQNHIIKRQQLVARTSRHKTTSFQQHQTLNTHLRFSPNPPQHQRTHLHYHLQNEIQEKPISKEPIFKKFEKKISSIMSINRRKFNVFSIRTKAFKLFFHLSNARLLCVHLKVLVFISLPSLYLFLSIPPYSFLILNLLSILAFLVTLFVCLSLAVPRLTSFRLRFTRYNDNYTDKSKKLALKPVVWSIGSRKDTLKRPNSGSWVQVYSNSDVYEGEIHKGKCSGSGVYYYSMSGRYEGDWIDDKYDGFGVETWARGSRYRGQYQQGLRHGIGVYRFYAGDVYAGEWSNGQCHGCGIHTCEDGSKYVGEFKWGVKHGFGRYHFRNGDTYAGEYFADKMHGFGVYQFGNGHRYEGAWHEGRRQGLGMYTFRNGESQSGHWQNGVLHVPGLGDSFSGYPYAISHLKVLDAVQEAQKAAEKAQNVASVDERVNKTISAANKAATAARVAAVKAVQRQAYRNNIDDASIDFV